MDFSTEVNKRFNLQEEYNSDRLVRPSSQPMVSVCIQTYQHAGYIQDCLEGILMQKVNFEYEIILGEDCSTDGTREICIQYAEKYPDKIRLFLRDRNLTQLKDSEGKLIRRLNGIFTRMSANGKYIAMCDGDDYWTDPSKLQKQVDYMTNNLECVFCTHSAVIIGENKTEMGQIRPYIKNTISKPEDIIMTSGNFFPTASYFIKNNPHLFQPTIPRFILISPVGDYALNLYFLSQGEIHYIDEPMSVYRTEVVGSYLYNHKRLNNQAKQKSIEDRIAMLQEFDVYSSKKYTFWVGQKIKQLEFKRYLLIGDSKALLSNDFKNNLKALGPKRRLLIYLKHYLPTIYKLIIKENNI